MLAVTEIEHFPKTIWLGKKIYSYKEIDSTNVQAGRLAGEGAEHGSLIVTDLQTAGRGRRGRQWNSPEGSGLYFSLILKPDIRPDGASMLTLVAAMAVTKAIERATGMRPGIKWPNDVVLSGKKVCGILTEMSIQEKGIAHIIVGIGINVNAQEFPEEIAPTATTLEQECGKIVSREQLLGIILEEFEYYYELYMSTMGLSLIQEEYNSCLVNRDRQVRVLDPQGDYEGIARGINSRGELLVEREGTVQTVNSGEVSVRGIYGYV